MPGLAPFKAQALMRDLKQRIGMTLAGAAYTDSLDASSYPQMLVVKGSESAFLKIEAVDNAGRVDALGIAQTSYSPHKCSLIQLADADAADDEMRAKVLAEAVKSFTEVWVYAHAAAGFPSTWSLAGCTLKAVIRSDAINPLTSQQ
jgi:hypothetical protein